MLPDVWTIVLAGGAGRRLAAITGGLPKQFWGLRPGRTLIEETVRRIAPLSPAEQRITVVDASHLDHVNRLRYRRALGTVVPQPGDRGTAAGVMLGLSAVLAADPDAVVLITPADHGVLHAGPFEHGLLTAVACVQARACPIVLLGVEAAAPAADYGWITPRRTGTTPVGRITPVAGFSEKPDSSEAERLFQSGAVWNTMVLVGRAQAVFDQCQRRLPDVADAFARAGRRTAADRSRAYEAAYRHLRSSDFSRDVLAHTRGLSLFTWPDRMGWSDLGTPERLRAWHDGSAAPAARASRRGAVVALPGVA